MYLMMEMCSDLFQVDCLPEIPDLVGLGFGRMMFQNERFEVWRSVV